MEKSYVRDFYEKVYGNSETKNKFLAKLNLATSEENLKEVLETEIIPFAKSLGYDEAFAINKEALFSGHPITDEQRKTVDVYAEKILAECKKKWSLWQKFKNRFVKIIY